MLNIRSVNLNLLPVFEAVYEEKSLSRAAVRLAMTQSAISHALSRLRSGFRDELFVRQSREVVRTEGDFAPPWLSGRPERRGARFQPNKEEPRRKWPRLKVCTRATLTVLRADGRILTAAFPSGGQGQTSTRSLFLTGAFIRPEMRNG